jgi:acetolactate synthase-1/2/3 large subunit
MATTTPRRRTVAPLLHEEVPTREAIVRVLEQAGIDTIFGMPGGNMGVLYNALYDHRDTIRCILVREEARAGVMAEVYGRLTGKPGVALGQAAFIANVSMGAIEAHLSSSPMLILTDSERQRALLAAWTVSVGRGRVRQLGRAAAVLRNHQDDDGG